MGSCEGVFDLCYVRRVLVNIEEIVYLNVSRVRCGDFGTGMLTVSEVGHDPRGALFFDASLGACSNSRGKIIYLNGILFKADMDV